MRDPHVPLKFDYSTSLRRRREALHLTASEVAAEMIISRQALSILEHRANARVRESTEARYLAALDRCVAAHNARRIKLGKALVQMGNEIIAGVWEYRL